jgi:hypothetical protein
MKKFAIVILFILAFSFLYTLNAEPIPATSMEVNLPNGQTVVVELDACYDPVTKRWGPCYVQSQENCKSENTK